MTFDPGAPTNRTRVSIDTGPDQPELDAIACVRVTRCVAVDTDGHSVSFDPLSPARRSAATIDGDETLIGVSCPTMRRCTAIDDRGLEVTFSPPSL